MQNGYNIRWTNLALQELKDTLQYLEEEFTEKEITKLANEIERVVTLISQNPDIFNIRKN